MTKTAKKEKKEKYRTPNTFEIILLVIGLLVLISGIVLIQKALGAPDPASSLQLLQTMFLWLILVGIIILVAVNENIKEEMKDLLTQLYKKKSKKK